MTGFVRFAGLTAVAAGAGVSFVCQQAVNTRLRLALGSAAWAGFASYLGGTLAMLLVVVVLREPAPTLAGLGRAPWWSWTGGAFGAVYIVVAILLLPRLGAATTIAAIILGQMLASALFDHFGALGLPRQAITLPRVIGAAMLVAGVVLIRR